MKARSIAFVAASLLVLSASQVGFAQDGESEKQPDGQPAQAAGEQAAEEPAADASAEESASADSADSEVPADQSGGEAAETAEGSEASAAKADQASEEPKVGPGGKPMRDDYPGTEESKKARMDTDRIEGLEFDEGETPEEVYDVRIRELETKVDDLKEKVFRSKSRIVLLKETVLSGNMAGSRAIVAHENDLGGAYVLKRAVYSLDGSRVYNKQDQDGSLDDKDEVEVYNGSISPGNHRVSVMLELKGSGYGLFSYMEGYKFTIKDSCEFSAQEGRSTLVSVRLIDRGGAMASYEERPGVECVVSSVKLTGKRLKQAAAESGSDTEEKEAAE